MNPVPRLRRALFGPPRPRTEFGDLATRVRRVPDAEMAVAEAALENGGAIAARIIRQLREAGDVWRLIGDDGGYELQISTTDDLMVRDVPREGWASEWIPVVTARDARPLELRIFVFEAGIAELLGRSRDSQPWPQEWQVPPGDLETVRATAPWIHLPTPADLRAARLHAAAAIAAWLGDDEAMRGRRGVVRADPPATDETIAAFAAREGFVLPEAYESLLRQVDGIEVGTFLVLGTRDAYRLDMPGPARLVIAPPNEDGALTIAESGEVVWVDLGDETTDGKVVATDLRRWLKRKLTRKPKARETA
jgi:hypothetical protein